MVSIYDLEVKCGSCDEVVEPEPPENRRMYGIGAAVLLGLLGLGIGATIGIATAGIGAPATVPLAVIGGYGGLKVGRWGAEKQDGVTCPSCGHEF